MRKKSAVIFVLILVVPFLANAQETKKRPMTVDDGLNVSYSCFGFTPVLANIKA